MKKVKIFWIIGNIASGKSTAVKEVNKHFNWPVIKEPIKENPLLEAFYNKPCKYALGMECFMKSCQFSKINKYTGHHNILSDYGIPEVFTNVAQKTGLLTQIERDYLFSIFELFQKNISKNISNFWIYLDSSPESCLERIEKRGREFEKNITIDYLKILHNEYEAFFKSVVNEYKFKFKVNYKLTLEQKVKGLIGLINDFKLGD